MQSGPRPEAIDTGLVLRVYAGCAIASGVLMYLWPGGVFGGLTSQPDLVGVPFGRVALVRMAAAVVTSVGVVAAGLASMDAPLARRRALYAFAFAHLVAGVMCLAPWIAVLDAVISPWTVWAPFILGAVLLYLAVTAPSLAAPLRKTHVLLGPADRTAGRGFVVDTRLDAVDTLRSQYEEQIRQAARLEERARLARDLHDAVKQQLFVIQTAAATADARYGADEAGARAALDQIRASAREASVEMEALIEELEAAPMGQAGLIESLKKQCEALGFRTGAEVKLEIGSLPPDRSLGPGAHEALFRAAQEALANVGRHARARHVAVTLGVSGDRLELAVRDDGAGFDVGDQRRGMGLRNMGARAVESGGTFSIDSSPGHGTVVRVSIPFDVESASDYRRKALIWAAVFIVTAGQWLLRGISQRPWDIAIVAIVAITAARYAVAYRRLRRTAGAGA